TRAVPAPLRIAHRGSPPTRRPRASLAIPRRRSGPMQLARCVRWRLRARRISRGATAGESRRGWATSLLGDLARFGGGPAEDAFGHGRRLGRDAAFEDFGARRVGGLAVGLGVDGELGELTGEAERRVVAGFGER